MNEEQIKKEYDKGYKMGKVFIRTAKTALPGVRSKGVIGYRADMITRQVYELRAGASRWPNYPFLKGISDAIFNITGHDAKEFREVES